MSWGCDLLFPEQLWLVNRLPSRAVQSSLKSHPASAPAETFFTLPQQIPVRSVLGSCARNRSVSIEAGRFLTAYTPWRGFSLAEGARTLHSAGTGPTLA